MAHRRRRGCHRAQLIAASAHRVKGASARLAWRSSAACASLGGAYQPLCGGIVGGSSHRGALAAARHQLIAARLGISLMAASRSA